MEAKAAPACAVEAIAGTRWNQRGGRLGTRRLEYEDFIIDSRPEGASRARRGDETTIARQSLRSPREGEDVPGHLLILFEPEAAQDNVKHLTLAVESGASETVVSEQLAPDYVTKPRAVGLASTMSPPTACALRIGDVCFGQGCMC